MERYSVLLVNNQAHYDLGGEAERGREGSRMIDGEADRSGFSGLMLENTS